MISVCNGGVKILVKLFLHTSLAHRGSSQGGRLVSRIILVRKHLVRPLVVNLNLLLVLFALITFFFEGTNSLNLAWDATVWNS